MSYDTFSLFNTYRLADLLRTLNEHKKIPVNSKESSLEIWNFVESQNKDWLLFYIASYKILPHIYILLF